MRHDPRRAALRTGVLVLAAAVAAWALFAGGRMYAGHDYLTAHAERRAAVEALERKDRETGTLRERLAVAEQSRNIDEHAYEELRRSLGVLNDEILRLRGELAFYQGIVSPADARRGLRVHNLRVEPNASEHSWRFRLVLIQAMQHDRQASGVARLTVAGTRDGLPHRVALAEVGEFEPDGIAYDFRYFQEFDGDILLPEGFEPARVEVELVPRNERDAKVERVFDWPTAS